jgi:hypothetical protein
MSSALHAIIEKYTILQQPTEALASYFQDHPEMYKGVLLVHHVFRAAAMIAFAC